MPLTLNLSSTQLQIIYGWAESIYPEECCGILLGKIESDLKNVVEVIPTINEWDSANLQTAEESHHNNHSRYTIPPQEIFLAQKRNHNLGLEIIGFFHSHPDCPAIPSECDRSQAWEIYSYPIVSVIQGRAIEIKSWILDDHRVFRSEKIQIIDPE